MHRPFFIHFLMGILLVHLVSYNTHSQIKTTPLEFLKDQEIKYKDTRGEVYLGKVLTLNYPAYAVDADKKYHSLLLELTDVLKTPLRRSYRIVLKGYSDNSGSSEENMRLSIERAETLKRRLIERYFMEEKRIIAKGYGEADPVASNETAEGRRLNRRVEVHIYGDVSKAVRFIERWEEAR